ETDVLVPVADAGDSVFVPSVSTRPGVIVRQILPGIAGRTVVFPDGAPGSFAEVGPPPLPMGTLVARFFESQVFFRHVSGSSGTSMKCRMAARLFPPIKTAQLGATEGALSSIDAWTTIQHAAATNPGIFPARRVIQ